MTNHGRAVSIRILDDRVIAFKQKMATEDARETYKQRAPVAEFPNAWIKTKLNCTRFHCRGRTKALAEATESPPAGQLSPPRPVAANLFVRD